MSRLTGRAPRKGRSVLPSRWVPPMPGTCHDCELTIVRKVARGESARDARALKRKTAVGRKRRRGCRSARPAGAAGGCEGTYWCVGLAGTPGVQGERPARCRERLVYFRSLHGSVTRGELRMAAETTAFGSFTPASTIVTPIDLLLQTRP